MVIAICSRKGGTGKSLLARSLAVAALMDGRQAAVIDCDVQASCLKWAARREAKGTPAVIEAAGESGLWGHLGTRIDRITDRAPGSAVVLVDSPPHAGDLIREIMGASDLVLIPVRPFPDDLEAVGATVQLVKELEIPAAIVINAAPTSAKALVMARSALATFAVPICPTAIVDRVAHPYAIAAGLVAAEYEPTGKAAAEVAAVWVWVKTLAAESNQRIKVSGCSETIQR